LLLASMYQYVAVFVTVFSDPLLSPVIIVLLQLQKPIHCKYPHTGQLWNSTWSIPNKFHKVILVNDNLRNQSPLIYCIHGHACQSQLQESITSHPIASMVSVQTLDLIQILFLQKHKTSKNKT
jgi:hypothetical protein